MAIKVNLNGIEKVSSDLITFVEIYSTGYSNNKGISTVTVLW